MSEPVYHLAEPDDWDRRSTNYTPAAFAEDGFVHCSTVEQLPAVATTLYRGRTDMILLEIDTDALADEVVYEDLYETGEEYPHIYAPIPVSAIVSAEIYNVSR